MKPFTAVRLLTGILFALYLISCASQNTDKLLNSDRIRNQFGGYGVDVLHADADQRISSLYSTSGGTKTTRTLAIVDYPQNLPGLITDEHQKIVAGGSIGEVFRSAGWAIEKHTVFVGEIDLAESDVRVGQLMQIKLPASLATHSYRFIVSRDESRANYATITEIHHPDYLNTDQLTALFGEMLFDDSGQKTLGDFVQTDQEW